ncbi:hypothetical protein BST61_g5540 [Cercospora zeina]
MSIDAGPIRRLFDSTFFPKTQEIHDKMQFSATLTALAGLLASGSLAAAQNAGNGNVVANRCNSRDVTGNQIVQGTAPIWNDCYALANDFQSGKFFSKSIKVAGTYRQTHGTCGFSITGKQGNFMLGADDAADLIRSTAQDLGARNGAYQTGLVPCDTPGTAGGDRGRQTGWTIGNLSLRRKCARGKTGGRGIDCSEYMSEVQRTRLHADQMSRTPDETFDSKTASYTLNYVPGKWG